MNRRNMLAPPGLMLALIIAISACANGDELPFGLKSEVVTRADRASPMAFAPDGRLFYGEQYTGIIRVVQADGQPQAEPFAQLQVATAAAPDWGLTGLAVDPNFASNHFVYAFFTQPLTSADPATGVGPTARPAIVRFRDENGLGVDQTVISEAFPAQTDPAHIGINANGRAHFGGDGFLYLSVGDYDLFNTDSQRVRSLSEPIGKLLRINAADGSAAPGNPFSGDPAADQRIFAYGFREPFPFAFEPESGAIYGTDNTTVSCEELNLIEEGGDYSWPVGGFPFSDCSADGQRPGIHYFARPNMQPGDFLSFVEASGLVFAPGSRYPSLGDSLFVCETRRADPSSKGALKRVVLSGPELKQVSADDLIANGCRGDLAVSPDGTLYYATDTEIRRLVPGTSSAATRATLP
jgi:glucose/arabinose dehydrogenase